MRWAIVAMMLAMPAAAQKAVMEGVNASRYTIKVDTSNGRVDVGTTSYNWGIANVGLHVASNVVVDSLSAKNACVFYATGSATCLSFVGDGSKLTNLAAGASLTSTQTWSGSNTFAGLGYTTQTVQGVLVVGSTLPIYGQFDVQGWTPILVSSIALRSGVTNATAGSIVVRGGLAYICTNGTNSGLGIYSVSNPIAPVILSEYAGPETNSGCVIQGNFAYLTNAGTLRILDISNPLSVTATGSVAYPGAAQAYGGDISGKFYYTSDDMGIIDVSDPTFPIVAGSTDTSGQTVGSNCNSVKVRGKYAYVGTQIPNSISNANAAIYDISIATSPILLSNVRLSPVASFPGGSALSGNVFYLVSGSVATAKIYAFDVSTPTAISPIGVTQIGPIFSNTANGRPIVKGNRLYIGGVGYFASYDVSASSAIVLMSSVSVTGSIFSIDVVGRYAYAVMKTGTGATGQTSLLTFDIGGTYSQSLEAGSIVSESLNVGGNIVAKDADLLGSIKVDGSVMLNGDVTLRKGISAASNGVNINPCGTLFFQSSNTVVGSTATTASAITSFSTYTLTANTMAIGDRYVIECAFQNKVAPVGGVSGVYLGATVLGTEQFLTLNSNHIVQTEITLEQTGQALMFNKAYSATATAGTYVSVTANNGVDQQVFDAGSPQTFNCKASRTGGAPINFVHMRVSRACN